MTPQRFFDLCGKAWQYFLASIEHPRQFPWLAWKVLGQGVHAGELLKLSQFRDWMQSAGIQTVIDVGAHTGEFASAARACLPAAMIYSFEPLPECQTKLHQRLAKWGRFQAFPVALGDAPGEITFWRSSFAKASSALPMSELHKTAFPWSAQNTPIKVAVSTLDESLAAVPLAARVLLKLDVQGFEHKVLRGGRRTLAQVDYVLVEVALQPLYEGQGSFDEIYRLLQSQGFEYAGNWEQLRQPGGGGILQVDALFARKS